MRENFFHAAFLTMTPSLIPSHPRPYTLNVPLPPSGTAGRNHVLAVKLFLTSLDATCSLSLLSPDSWHAHNEIVGALGT